MKIISILRDPCGNTKMLIYTHRRDICVKERFRIAVEQEGITGGCELVYAEGFLF